MHKLYRALLFPVCIQYGVLKTSSCCYVGCVASSCPRVWIFFVSITMCTSVLCQSWTPTQVVPSFPPCAQHCSRHPPLCLWALCTRPSLGFVPRSRAVGHGVHTCGFAQVLPACFYNGCAGSYPYQQDPEVPVFPRSFQISALSVILTLAFTIGIKWYLIVLSSSDKDFTSVVLPIVLHARLCRCLVISWLGRESVFWLNVLCPLSFSFPSYVLPTVRSFS